MNLWHKNKATIKKIVTSMVAACSLVLATNQAPSGAQTANCSYGCDVGEVPGQITAQYKTSTSTLTVKGTGTLSKSKWKNAFKKQIAGTGSEITIIFAGASDGSAISLPADSSFLFSPSMHAADSYQGPERKFRYILPANLDTSKVTSMNSIFSAIETEIPNISHWDTSNVTDMSFMFYRSYNGNPDMSKWDTSNVTNMSYTFALTNADPDVSQWNTSKVTDMSWMYGYNETANPNVKDWDVSNVTNIDNMFWHATAADPDISKWEYRSLKSAKQVFCGATNATKWKSTSLGKQLKECGESTVSYDGVGKDDSRFSPAVIGAVTVIALLLLALGAASQMGLLPLVMPRP